MERVNKTQVLRCGWVSHFPSSTKNPDTDALEGYVVDLMEEAGRRMGLAVDWAHETNWPLVAADLQAGKCDVACATFWSNPLAARHMLATRPFLYQPLFFVVRAGDTRLDAGLAAANDPAFTVAVLEGDAPQDVLRVSYPRARVHALPPSAEFDQLFQEVASGKADATLAAAPETGPFLKSHPGVLKIVAARPVRVYANALQLPQGAVDLKNALDVTLREMEMDGTTAAILARYAQGPHDYRLPAKPYHAE
jgi:ABC-type amino acid transport substrate-binding protein